MSAFLARIALDAAQQFIGSSFATASRPMLRGERRSKSSSRALGCVERHLRVSSAGMLPTRAAA
jgi:hypothetical protein